MGAHHHTLYRGPTSIQRITSICLSHCAHPTHPENLGDAQTSPESSRKVATGHACWHFQDRRLVLARAAGQGSCKPIPVSCNHGGCMHGHFRNRGPLLACRGAMASDRGGVGADRGTSAWVERCHGQPTYVVRNLSTSCEVVAAVHASITGDATLPDTAGRLRLQEARVGAVGTRCAAYLRRARLMLAAYTGTSEIGGHPAVGRRRVGWGGHGL
ncbi:hypothetical protein DFH08DRAFT_812515 [Mycena albidolilacea]|uniref:Uncharacterized protein n=1 Tax=Mycena albidolilacea TaxID=1033008 RepID=A0AAD6ZTL4_9AGAR|nr:hypothetical protein DFH08DRAFT_812515 [Mycena albidolilacea]